MKRRTFFLLLAAIASALFLAGTAGFAWVFAHSPLKLLQGSPQPNPQAIIFVPKQAPAMVSLLVNPDRLDSLQQALAQPEQRQLRRAEFATLRTSILGAGLDYRQDVQPWLGNELTAAITTLDIDRDGENGLQPGYLLALTTQNALRSREFLQLFWQKRSTGQDLTFEQYQGTQIIYGSIRNPSPTEEDAPPLTLATAVVGNRFVLFANSPKVLRNAINSVQAVELNLGHDADYQRLVAALSDARIGLAYFNIPALATLLGNSVNPLDLPSGAARTAAAGLGLKRQGLLLETALLGASPTPALLSRLSQTLQYIPSTASVVATGTQLDQAWPKVLQTVQPYTQPTRWLTQALQAGQSRWRLDLAQDIFPSVTGEYAIGMLPAERGAPSEWVIVAAPSPDDQSDSGLQAQRSHLDELARQQGLTPNQVQVGQQPVAVWTRLTPDSTSQPAPPRPDLKAQVAGAWAQVDSSVIVTSSLEAMELALNAPQHPITQYRPWVDAITALPRPNNGSLYMEWPQLRAWLEQRLPILRLLSLVSQPWSSRLQSLTVSSVGEADELQLGRAFLQVAATDKPKT
jgi:hypothetical protein